MRDNLQERTSVLQKDRLRKIFFQYLLTVCIEARQKVMS